MEVNNSEFDITSRVDVEDMNDSSFWSTTRNSNENLDDLSFDNEEQTKEPEPVNVPEQKIRSINQDNGIDTTPILGVKAVKKIFDKSTSPLPLPGGVPKVQKGRTKGQTSTSQSDTDHLPPAESSAPFTINLAGKAIDTPVIPDYVVSEQNLEGNSKFSTSIQNLSDEEFEKLLNTNGCKQAFLIFQKQEPVNIIIKPATTDNKTTERLFIKQAMLQFNNKHRVIVMIRDKTERYISLNKIWKMDASPNALDVFKKYLKKNDCFMKNSAITLYFTTTPNPMIIVFKDPSKRDALFTLVRFLRETIETSVQLEVVT